MLSSLSSTHTSGADNARAKVATINALYELHCFTCSRVTDSDEPVILSADAAEILSDNDLTVDDNDDTIDDAIWDTLRADCLGVDYSATWSSGSDFDGNPQSFKVWLTVGGPSCYITGDFGRLDIPETDSLKVWFSWGGPTDCIPLSDADREAIGWYVEQVAV